MFIRRKALERGRFLVLSFLQQSHSIHWVFIFLLLLSCSFSFNMFSILVFYVSLFSFTIIEQLDTIKVLIFFCPLNVVKQIHVKQDVNSLMFFISLFLL